MKALLGGLCDVSVDVTHRTPSPGSGFVAVQPAGNAGAVTPSQFSMHSSVPPIVAVGVAEGGGDAPIVAVGVGVPGVGVTIGPLAERSYASTSATPVPLFTPESKAVYCPGAKVS